MKEPRMTPERKAEIYACIDLGFTATRSYVERIAMELRAELDAVTRERDEAHVLLGKAIHERDEARTVTDEMVERAAQVVWGGGATPSGYETPWRNRYANWQHDGLLSLARRALTAAMAKEPANA